MQTNFVSEKAKVHPSVKLGNFITIHDNVEIGADSIIEDYCIIGYPVSNSFKGQPLKIGQGSLIRSHSVLYEGSFFGDGLMVGHHCMVREGVVAGVSFQIGSYNDLEGDCHIGDYVRFHSNVHIGRGAVVKDFVWMFPNVVLTNDPIPPSGLKEGVTVEEGAIIATGAVLFPGCIVGKGAFVAAMSRGKGHIPPASLIVGFEGKNIGGIDKLKHKASGKQHPWMSHFSSYYPAEAQDKIRKLHAEINEELEKLRHV
jgi:UDP-3-O-[3-hydroxymyristoyl] glucosamine N-acyltransferase